MALDHDILVWFSKFFGLFYLLALSLIVLVYAYWPANRKPFERAANAILHDDDDRPYRG